MVQSDLSWVAELEIALFPDNCMNEKTLEVELANGFGLVTGGIGYALCRVEEGLVDVLRLGVHQDHRNQGLATAMLRHILARPGKVILCVRKTNEVALRLYMRQGLRIVGGVFGVTDSWVLST